MTGGEKLLVGGGVAVVGILLIKKFSATATVAASPAATPTVVSSGDPGLKALLSLQGVPVVGPAVQVAVLGNKYLAQPVKNVVQKALINPLNTAIGAGTTTVTANGIKTTGATGPVGWYDNNIGKPVSMAITTGVKATGHFFESLNPF